MPDTNPDAVKLLSDDEVVEIEARANAATPRYCVDWEKGRHALLQDRGWRSASEEQPRTIATFDRENGYLDLLFCAEARTDIPALCATVRALRAESERLHTDVGEMAQRLMRSADRCGELIIDKETAESENTALREQLARLQLDHNSLRESYEQLEEDVSKLITERNSYRERLLQAVETQVEI